jgi:hypothetical protein
MHLFQALDGCNLNAEGDVSQWAVVGQASTRAADRRR